jgi:hypothetical protein
MAIRYDVVTKPVTKPRNETPTVTKLDKAAEIIGMRNPLLRDGTAYFAEYVRDNKPRVGRPPAGAVAMSGAERMREVP